MAISYRKLFTLLSSRGMRRTELAQAASLSSVTLAKLGKNESVTGEKISDICKVLHCQPGDIMEYVPDCNIGEQIKRGFVYRIQDFDMLGIPASLRPKVLHDSNYVIALRTVSFKSEEPLDVLCIPLISAKGFRHNCLLHSNSCFVGSEKYEHPEQADVPIDEREDDDFPESWGLINRTDIELEGIKAYKKDFFLEEIGQLKPEVMQQIDNCVKSFLFANV